MDSSKKSRAGTRHIFVYASPCHIVLLTRRSSVFRHFPPHHRCFASRVLCHPFQNRQNQKFSALNTCFNIDTRSQPTPTPPSSQIHPFLPSGHPPPLMAVILFTPLHPVVIFQPAGGEIYPSPPSGHFPPLPVQCPGVILHP